MVSNQGFIDLYGKAQMKTLHERFWAKVDKSGDCWLWIAAKDVTGYGFFRCVSGQNMRKAHRVSYELAYGPIPAGQGHHGTVVMHTCDTPSCVRPSHLILGTQQQNVSSASGKRRMASGERAAASKLSPTEVREIRQLRKQFGFAHPTIGRAYGVNASIISLLVRRKTWTHT